jgi:hypothetical protein
MSSPITTCLPRTSPITSAATARSWPGRTLVTIANPASSMVRSRSVLSPSVSSSALLEDHEHAQLFVADELVLGTGGNKDRVAFTQVNLLAFDVKRSSAFKHDVDFVVDVGLLMIGLGGDEDVEPISRPADS